MTREPRTVAGVPLDVACHLNVVSPDVAPERLPVALEALAGLGYRRVVLPPLDPASTDVAFVRDAIAGCGLSPVTIAGVMPGADVSSADPDERAAGAALLRGALDLTVALGGDQMNGVPYGLFGPPAGPTSAEAFERSAVEVGRIADEAHERGVRMTFEVLNRYETSVLNTARQAMDFVAASGSENLWIHLDTFHMGVEEASLRDAVRTALPRLAFLELGQSGRGALEPGAVDIAGVVSGALADGYTGRWGVEAFSRAVLDPGAAGMLAVWRTTYEDGVRLAADAMDLVVRSASRVPAASPAS